MKRVTLDEIHCEVYQHPDTRVDLIQFLEKTLDRQVVAFFTSFKYPASILDQDAALLENVLLNMDLKKGLTLFLSSPGGSGLTAERIVNICRVHSKNDFEVLVPGQAKSAATIICFGAKQILMSKTSELGPIDPQLTLKEGGEYKFFSAYDIIESYESLFMRAVKTKGNLEPFIAQLEHYDERDIAKFKRHVELSEDIAIKLLKQGMMSRFTKKEITKRIKVFLSPVRTKVHGRPIFIEDAKKVGLKVKEIDIQSKLWNKIQEYSARLNYITNNQYLKVIETSG